MGVKSAVLFLAVILYSCSSEGNNRIPAVEFTGKDLFIQRCAVCHGVDGGLQGSNSPDLRNTRLSKQEIMKMLKNGGNGMPAFKTIISSSEEKNNIVDYVLTLKK